MLELDTIKKLGGNLDDHFEEMLNPTPSRDMVAHVQGLSKTYVEDCSKVVDENGEPSVVYHGSRSADMVKSPDFMSKVIKPASVDSIATPSFSLIQNISDGILGQDGVDVNDKKQDPAIRRVVMNNHRILPA